MTDSLSGHTAAQNTLGADGLRDGDALSSATLTNILQNAHGNGIIRLQDGAFGSTRNATNTQPGAMVKDADIWKLVITGGYVVLDGVLYEFANGPGNTATIELGNTGHGVGGIQLTSAGEEALYVIYVASNGGIANIHYEGGSPVNTTNGLYPTIPSQYLIDYDTVTAQTNMKTIVLGVVRVKYKSAASAPNQHDIDIQEINDKRVFIAPPISYMPPVSSGSIIGNKVSDGGTEGINTVAHLRDLLHTGGEIGDMAASDSLVAVWPSHPRYGVFTQTPPLSTDAGYGQGAGRGEDSATNHVINDLYFAGRNNEGTGNYSARLVGRGVDAPTTNLTTNGIWTISADGDSIFIFTLDAGVVITLNAQVDASSNYMFPEGHLIDVRKNHVNGSIVFDAAGLNYNMTVAKTYTFVYDGNQWLLLRD
ncbi:MAG: hypothetical protein HOC79_05435 [Euryarchaeota archaeon]|jgi:hypothetical protein|nr:hypothetical protein [Euryarchaeota archaeon]